MSTYTEQRVRMRAEALTVVRAIVREQGLSQADAAVVLGTTQPRVSDLMCGKVDVFSLDQLVAFLGRFGWRLHFSYERGQLTVRARCG